jgi:hypothetical protein
MYAEAPKRARLVLTVACRDQRKPTRLPAINATIGAASQPRPQVGRANSVEAVMRGLHMSTGAWIFTGLVTAAVVAPTAVYAAATSTVAIGNANGAATATVTGNHQLLTTTVAPKDVVHAVGSASNSCAAVYVPPAGKAIVLTSVTYDMFNNTAGNQNFAVLTGLAGAACTGPYDVVDTDLVNESETRIFPIGLPMPSVGIQASGGTVQVYLTGYLIPASQLPAAPPA